MTWKAEPGATFLCPSGSTHNHLFVVVSWPADLPNEPRGQVLAVNLSSVPTEDVPYDKTMVLKAGSHKFVAHDSYLACRYARKFEVAPLERNVNSGAYPSHDPFARATVDQMRTALCASPLTPNYIKRQMDEDGL